MMPRYSAKLRGVTPRRFLPRHRFAESRRVHASASASCRKYADTPGGIWLAAYVPDGTTGEEKMNLLDLINIFMFFSFT
ncbi:hypothetical protein DPMN_125683 [Dreissena polymorpha]|uniref:Uncharacterized protein n=1 Tax=Dreissena polymorpha TaxID=45954 RepID=A0A9D4GY78_DREPO|nr:hypothetical protein DPMN_125683 [Dreissena polymorpha]